MVGSYTGILDIILEFDQQVRVSLVISEANKADALTKAWLKVPIDADNGYTMCSIENKYVKTLHEMYHMGVERTILTKKIPLTGGIVYKVVQACQQCQSIYPTPSIHEASGIHVSKNWVRLKRDITHYHNGAYLSVVECGPGRIEI